ncbi:MAG: hypothetical protein OXF56_02190 [Rhodobacteraceae bacterium]|nr:hypothetical protein [Paracoccaceae bacterium]
MADRYFFLRRLRRRQDGCIRMVRHSFSMEMVNASTVARLNLGQFFLSLRVNGETLQGFVRAHTEPGATIYTDDAAAYRGLALDLAS